MLINPLLRTEAGIRRYVLRNIPIGSSMEYSLDVINYKMWDLRIINENWGVVLHPTLNFPMRKTPSNRFPVIGEQHIRVHLGGYFFILRADVTAYFAFDENGKLIDVFIRKEWDAL